MRTFKRTSLLVMGVVLWISACVMPTISFVDPSAQATSVALTVLAMVAETQQGSPSQPPTATSTLESPTPTLTPSQTATLTLTATPFVFSTVTPMVPMISVTVPTNCRTGPGKVYRIVGALLVGETAQVYARDPTGDYWYIANPDSPGNYCWVWGGYATLWGPTSSLPIYTPRPTPKPTFTPTPEPGFDVSYQALLSCSGDWWVRIRLENTGMVTFRSLSLTVKDTVTSTSVTKVENGFTDRLTCASSSTKATLAPDKAATVSSAEFADNPDGHKLRATIKLCSKVDQEGICLSDTITFTP